MSTKNIQIVGGIIPQPNWNQTDTTKVDYIKNRPFGVEEKQLDYISFITGKGNVLDDVFLIDSIGLIAGETYSVDLITDTDTTNLQLTARAVSEELGGFYCVVLDYSVQGTIAFQVADKVDIDSNNALIGGTKTACLLDNKLVQEIKLNGFSSTITTVNKLSNEYLNIDQTYSATSENAQSGLAVAEAIAALKTEILGGLDEVLADIGGAE